MSELYCQDLYLIQMISKCISPRLNFFLLRFLHFHSNENVNLVEIDPRSHQRSHSFRPRHRRNSTSIYDRSMVPDAFSFTLGDFYRGNIGNRPCNISRAFTMAQSSSLFNEISPLVSFSPNPFFLSPFALVSLSFSLFLSFCPRSLLLVLSKYFRPDRRRISAGRKIYVPAK